MSTTVLSDRLERLLSDEIHLRCGAGKGANGEVDVCLVQAADWLAGGSGQSDHPDCVSRKVADYCIALNDSLLFAEHRDLLKPYAAKIVGTAGPSGDREVRRAYLLADYAIRVFVPIWLRADPEHRFDAHAKACEECAPIVDEESREAARRVAASAAYATDAASAASAASAAYAAYAASAASAAYAADAADAASAASAAYAADAADAAYARKTARTKVLAQFGDTLRAKALECLDALIAIPLTTEARA